MGQAQSQQCNVSKQKQKNSSLGISSSQANDKIATGSNIMKTFVESRGGGNVDDDDDNDDEDTSKKKSKSKKATKKSRIKNKHSIKYQKCSNRHVNNNQNQNGKSKHLLKNDVELIVRKKLITTTTTLQPLSDLAKHQKPLPPSHDAIKRESQKRKSLKINKASPSELTSDVNSLHSKDEFNSEIIKCSNGDGCQCNQIDCDATK
jgi:hypothetical protein